MLFNFILSIIMTLALISGITSFTKKKEKILLPTPSQPSSTTQPTTRKRQSKKVAEKVADKAAETIAKTEEIFVEKSVEAEAVVVEKDNVETEDDEIEILKFSVQKEDIGGLKRRQTEEVKEIFEEDEIIDRNSEEIIEIKRRVEIDYRDSVKDTKKSARDEPENDVSLVEKKMEFLRKCNEEELSRYLNNDDPAVIEEWYNRNGSNSGFGKVQEKNKDYLIELDKKTDVEAEVTIRFLSDREPSYRRDDDVYNSYDDLKEKVINKTSTVIASYDDKLERCKEEKERLEEKLHDCKESKEDLIKKIIELKEALKKCSGEKEKLIKIIKALEKELKELEKKIEFLEKKLVESEVEKEELKDALRRCREEKEELRKKVIKLLEALEKCKKGKQELIDKIEKLEKDLKKAIREIEELVKALKDAKEEIDDLIKKIKYLEIQNEALKGEVIDLKEQLAKTLKALQIITCKYNDLKKKCCKKC